MRRHANFDMTCANDVGHASPAHQLSRPRIHQAKDAWYIHFDYQNYHDLGFALRIKHNYAGDRDEMRVVAMDMGDEVTVLTPAAHRAKADEIAVHEDVDLNIAYARMEGKYMSIDSDTFWDRVDDARRRWEAMLFLFAPAVT